jgi:hypothetical protein
VVVVAGDVSRLAPGHRAWPSRELVPNRLAAPVLAGRAFDLVGGGRRAPQKAHGKETSFAGFNRADRTLAQVGIVATVCENDEAIDSAIREHVHCGFAFHGHHAGRLAELRHHVRSDIDVEPLTGDEHDVASAGQPACGIVRHRGQRMATRRQHLLLRIGSLAGQHEDTGSSPDHHTASKIPFSPVRSVDSVANS